MTTQIQLISKLQRSGILQTPQIIQAFQEVDRGDFVKEGYINSAYEDRPLPIGYGQTISQPTTVAFMLERLQPRRGERILDVGSGSGWTTALLANLVGPSGKIIGTERIEELVKFGKVNLNKYNYKQARIIFSESELGWSEEAPYDKILVSAAAQELPAGLVEQLSVGGEMVIPIKSSLHKINKKDDGYDEQEFYGFTFVPLIEESQEETSF